MWWEKVYIIMVYQGRDRWPALWSTLMCNFHFCTLWAVSWLSYRITAAEKKILIYGPSYNSYVKIKLNYTLSFWKTLVFWIGSILLIVRVACVFDPWWEGGGGEAGQFHRDGCHLTASRPALPPSTHTVLSTYISTSSTFVCCHKHYLHHVESQFRCCCCCCCCISTGRAVYFRQSVQHFVTVTSVTLWFK